MSEYYVHNKDWLLSSSMGLAGYLHSKRVQKISDYSKFLKKLQVANVVHEQ